VYLAPPQGVIPSEFREKCLMLVKLEWLGYRTVKNYDDMLSSFHLIPEPYGQTDKGTDGRTNRFSMSISRVSMLTRDKNVFYRASAYWRAIHIANLSVRPSVCPSVRPWRSGVRWKRLNISSPFFSPYSSPIILVLLASNIFTKSNGFTPAGALNTGGV